MKWLRSIILGGGAVFLALYSAFAQAESKEYYVKAAFLYNFVKFVEWPDTKAIANVTNIDICVLGSNPFGEAESVFREASTERLKLTLLHERAWKGTNANCHILFISRSEAGDLEQVLAALRTAPVLTVSEIEGFANRGGMIGFVTYQNKIKLVINRKAASTAGLRVDAQLLEVAHEVIDK